MKTLILGGVRSGKSRRASALAGESSEVTLIATAEALDEEMRARIAAHRAERPAHWAVVEEPIRLAAALREACSPTRVVIVDCLTLWLSNLLCGADGRALEREQAEFLDIVPRLPGTTVFVSNEVGFGIMPMNALARRFADAAGVLHQRLGQLCDRVVLMTAGLPLTLKALLLAALLWGTSSVATNPAVAAASAAVAPEASDDPVTLRDDLGREVTIAHAPRRLVTMIPSLTETVCALGACDRLVATDRFSNWPATVVDLPKAGGLDDAGVEMIVSVKPDLVLLAKSQRISDRLAELGVPSFVLETHTYADIARMVTTVGRILRLDERAAVLNADIDAQVHRIAGSDGLHRSGDAGPHESGSGRHEGAMAVREAAGGPSVYFEIDRGPYAAGASSFIGEELALLGARNIVTPDLGPFPKLNPEFVVSRNPDVIIFIGAPGTAHLAERPGWAGIRAVRENRVCFFAPGVRDTLVRPGPRVAEGMTAMADCLHRVSP